MRTVVYFIAGLIFNSLKVFAERGYAGATTNHIAERAGVSIGSLYQYFPNKEAILVALLERHMSALRPVIEESLQEMGDPNIPPQEVSDLFREKAAQAGIRLEVDLEPGLKEAALDQDAIHTSLSNLVSNAIDACQVAEQTRDFVVTLSSKEENGVLIYEVADNGLGMDYEISKKVFSKRVCCEK